MVARVCDLSSAVRISCGAAAVWAAMLQGFLVYSPGEFRRRDQRHHDRYGTWTGGQHTVERGAGVHDSSDANLVLPVSCQSCRPAKKRRTSRRMLARPQRPPAFAQRISVVRKEGNGSFAAWNLARYGENRPGSRSQRQECPMSGKRSPQCCMQDHAACVDNVGRGGGNCCSASKQRVCGLHCANAHRIRS